MVQKISPTYVTIVSYQSGESYMHVTTNKDKHDRHVKEIQSEVDQGASGMSMFAKEIHNVLMDDFWIQRYTDT